MQSLQLQQVRRITRTQSQTHVQIRSLHCSRTPWLAPSIFSRSIASSLPSSISRVPRVDCTRHLSQGGDTTFWRVVRAQTRIPCTDLADDSEGKSQTDCIGGIHIDYRGKDKSYYFFRGTYKTNCYGLVVLLRCLAITLLHSWKLVRPLAFGVILHVTVLSATYWTTFLSNTQPWKYRHQSLRCTCLLHSLPTLEPPRLAGHLATPVSRHRQYQCVHCGRAFPGLGALTPGPHDYEVGQFRGAFLPSVAPPNAASESGRGPVVPATAAAISGATGVGRCQRCRRCRCHGLDARFGHPHRPVVSGLTPHASRMPARATGTIAADLSSGANWVSSCRSC